MIFIEVIEIVFPVFFLSFLGFFWVKKGFEYPMQFVTRLCMNIAVPCLVFVSIMNTKKITSLLVNKSKKSQKTIGVVHIHTILQSNIS